jgi:hypothetical protein
MADLATLEARLAELQAMRASGVTNTRFSDGREVGYKTDAQMAEAIADLQQQIASARGQQVRMVRFSCGKGV